MTKASEFHKSGYNCGEAIIKAYNEERGTDIPVEIGTAFGGGMSIGSTCGSIGGAVAIIGYLKGRKDPAEKNEARALTQKIMKDISEKYKTYNCRELKQNGITCEEIINYTYESLKNEIK